MMIRPMIAAAALALSAAGAFAQSDRCRVMDPTGTPLNVRDAPNGRIIGRLQNGMLVNRVDQVDDARGRAWAAITNRRTGAPIGWVFREFVSCF